MSWDSVFWWSGLKHALWASFLSSKPSFIYNSKRYLGIGTIAKYRIIPSLAYSEMLFNNSAGTSPNVQTLRLLESKGNIEFGSFDLKGEHSQQYGGWSMGFYDFTRKI